jgi:hypothetical protein
MAIADGGPAGELLKWGAGAAEMVGKFVDASSPDGLVDEWIGGFVRDTAITELVDFGIVASRGGPLVL